MNETVTVDFVLKDNLKCNAFSLCLNKHFERVVMLGICCKTCIFKLIRTIT